MTASSPSTFARLLPILFVSGACSLVYQVVWLRLLRMVFGASTEASAAVVAIFMGGLGLGGWWFGRRTRNLSQPLRLYAGLEAGIALGAALSPLFVAAARWAMVAIGGAAALGGLASPVRLLLAAVVLGLPTFLMGGTLPVAVHAVERDADIGRRRVAWLYGVNTLGAVTGALAANFALVEWLGVSRSLALAAVANLLLAAIAFGLARAVARDGDTAADPEPTAAAPATPNSGATATAGRSLLPRRLLLAVAALVGFVYFVMELVWYRMLAPILGGSTYTMGLILAVALLGIGGGGLLYALGGERRRPTVAALAATCALEALALAVPFALGDSLALLTAYSRDLSSLGFGGLVVSWSLVTVITVLPASLLAGYQFPLLVGLLGQGAEDAGDDVGTAYAWNTAGAIAGSLAGGFGLLPLLSAPGVWRLGVVVLVLTALALTLRAAMPQRSGARLPALIAAVLAVVTISAEGPTAFWRHMPIGAGRAPVDHLDGPNGWIGVRRDVAWATRMEVDGVESSIALQVINDPVLMVNGKSDGSGRGDASTMVMSGVLGSALHPDPDRVLVIGLGLGATAGFYASAPGVEHVDIVELEPAVVDVSRRIGPLNFHVLDAPTTNLHLGDGREFVATAHERWDVIFSQPSNPYRAGVADLFTLDFYRAVVPRLEEGGLFLQWLQAYEIDPPLVQSVYASLTEVFPHVETWLVGRSDLLLVASLDAVDHDPRRLDRWLGQDVPADAMRRVTGTEGLAGLYSGYLAGPELARVLTEGARPSTEDRPTIEFAFARTVGREHLFSIADLVPLARRLGVDRPPSLDDASWQRALDLRRMRFFRGTANDADALAESLPRDRARDAYRQGDLGRAASLWAAQPAGPDRDDPRAAAFGDALLVAETLADAGSDAAPPWIDRVAADDPAAGAALAARLAARRGDHDQAVGLLLRAFAELRRDAWSDRPVGTRALDLAIELASAPPPAGPKAAAALHTAIDQPFAGWILEQERIVNRTLLLGRSPDVLQHCVPFFEAMEDAVLWIVPILESRAACYTATDHPLAAAARRDVERQQAQDGGDFLVRSGPAGPLAATETRR